MERTRSETVAFPVTLARRDQKENKREKRSVAGVESGQVRTVVSVGG